MDNQIAVRQEGQLNREQVDLLKRTVCKGATDDEFKLFTLVASKSGLNPFSNQIHAVKRWDNRLNREVMTIQTGIDGYRCVAQRTGAYAGSDDAVFEEKDNMPTKATVTVYKMISGQRCPFTATARWSEYKQTKKDGSLNNMWAKFPFLMLSKCAEALALRKGFPQELSGIYTHEEMQQADNEIVNVDTGEVTPTPNPTKGLKKTPPTLNLNVQDNNWLEIERMAKEMHEDLWEDYVMDKATFTSKKDGRQIRPKVDSVKNNPKWCSVLIHKVKEDHDLFKDLTTSNKKDDEPTHQQMLEKLAKLFDDRPAFKVPAKQYVTDKFGTKKIKDLTFGELNDVIEHLKATSDDFFKAWEVK